MPTKAVVIYHFLSCKTHLIVVVYFYTKVVGFSEQLIAAAKILNR